MKAMIIEERIQCSKEEDSRWIGEVPDLPGVIVYEDSKEDAILKVEVLALRVIADRIEHGEEIPEFGDVEENPCVNGSHLLL